MKFGEHITVTQKYVRYRSGPKKYWALETIPETSCLLIGVRTLQDGLRHWNYEEGYSFQPTKHFRAILVVESPKKNPFYTPDLCDSRGFRMTQIQATRRETTEPCLG